MKTEELLLIGGALVAFYLISKKAPVAAVPVSAPAQVAYPTPAVSPYYGYPPNIMNSSPSANNGQSWSTQDTAALISGLAGIGTAAINTFGNN